MNMKIAAGLACMAVAFETAAATFIFETAAATAGTTTSNALILGSGTGAVGVTTAGLALGVVALKGLALAGLLIASRSRRAAVEIDSADTAFYALSASEPAQCYRRLICDLATGQMAKSENDIIVNLFDKDTAIESPKFEFATAAKLGKSHKNVAACELRYSCPLTGEQIQGLF